jgi:hypothetical protein
MYLPKNSQKLFHHYQETLARDFDCEPRLWSSPSWEQTPQNERKLMIAAARLALLELSTTANEENSHREYFAKPGEAEWGG